jgi:hypothetical protein
MVYGCPDREAYIDIIFKIRQHELDEIRARTFINTCKFRFCLSSVWDDEG